MVLVLLLLQKDDVVVVVGIHEKSSCAKRYSKTVLYSITSKNYQTKQKNFEFGKATHRLPIDRRFSLNVYLF